jgi:flagellar L-ring protein FlgH
MNRTVLLCLLPPVLCAGAAARADDIWGRRIPCAAYLFETNRARRVGDLLTIAVQENTGIDQTEARDMDKETTTGSVFSFQGGTTGNVNSKTAAANYNTSLGSTRTFTGKANFSSARQFLDQMTVRVVRVMPNGDLVIQGSRSRIVTGETRTLVVSGIVRPIDIDVGNIIASQFIGNFQITYQGAGPESHFSSQNWLARIVNHVWPF